MIWSDDPSPPVLQFLLLFAKLKYWTDDDPKHLLSSFDTDDGLQRVVRTLNEAAEELRDAELRDRQLFSRPTDPRFITMWRDYETRFEPAVARLLSIFRDGPVLKVPMKETEDERWERANFLANELLDEISDGITEAASRSGVTDPSQLSNYQRNIEFYFEHLSDLHNLLGFDIRGAYRRRLLMPFTLVPRHVSKDYGNTDRVSLFVNLQQANDAFILGAPFGCLVLLRSIVEGVLRDHYRATGKDGDELINSVRRLPSGVTRDVLHNIRMMANSVVHMKSDDRVLMPKLHEQKEFELKLFHFINATRALLEGAPPLIA